jgi:carbonic anhydrase
MVRANVETQLSNLCGHPVVAAAIAAGRLSVHGWVYDIASGSIVAFDGTSKSFLALDKHRDVHATPIKICAPEESSARDSLAEP